MLEPVSEIKKKEKNMSVPILRMRGETYLPRIPSFEEEFDRIMRRPGQKTLEFENLLRENGRREFLKAEAERISALERGLC